MAEPLTNQPTNFVHDVVRILDRLDAPHHPAMTGTPAERHEARQMFARYARNYGRINRGNYDPRDTDHRQDWTGILLEAVYDVLANPSPTRQRELLPTVAALCTAWAVDIETDPDAQ